MKLAPFGHDRAAAPAGQKQPTPEESVKLVEAFNRIADPAQQSEVLALAERFASENPKFAAVLQRLKSKH